MEDLTAYAAFGGLVFTVLQFVKFLDLRDWASARNQGLAWLAGIVVTLLAAQTSFAVGIPTLGDATLAVSTFWDQIFIGLTVAGIAGAGYTFTRAVAGRAPTGQSSHVTTSN